MPTKPATTRDPSPTRDAEFAAARAALDAVIQNPHADLLDRVRGVEAALQFVLTRLESEARRP